MRKSQLNDKIDNIIDIYKIITLLLTNLLSLILKIKNN
ncbi:hypothetical protein BGAPBR_E0046 (plasmid) [Borreliella garinii PBr]|uniref:Uncharacterized protein n=1 Tax=Borreliella garinii PBr TaxID=498743 RepID=B8F0M6_BORGR|nr:hypothetical protein BGAPBR_E0046 [Borreliella garinii PBr]